METICGTWTARPPASREARKSVVVLSSTGLGLLEVSECGRVSESLAPRIKPPKNDIGPYLCEAQKRAVAPGSARGGHATTFSQTRAHAEAFVSANPGCSVQQLVLGIEHHYDTNRYAAARIDQLARKRVFTFTRKGTGKNARFWPA